MRVIESEADIAEGLAWLTRRDRRLRPVLRVAGPVPLRRAAPGFTGLARVVVGQQLSIASAEAIWTRFAAAFPGGARPMPRAADERRSAPSAFRTPRSRRSAPSLRPMPTGLDLDGLADAPRRRGPCPPHRDQGHRPVDGRRLSPLLPRPCRRLPGRRPRAPERRRRRLRPRRSGADRRASRDGGEMVAVAGGRGAPVLVLLSRPPQHGRRRRSDCRG